jgi:hypothetical protein
VLWLILFVWRARQTERVDIAAKPVGWFVTSIKQTATYEAVFIFTAPLIYIL